MEALLELVQVEQNIYNVVFHEVIRQVSVGCAERGQLLAKLRLAANTQGRHFNSETPLREFHVLLRIINSEINLHSVIVLPFYSFLRLV